MTLQQTIVRDLATLDEAELGQVAQYLSLLKIRAQARQQSPQSSPQEWQALYRDAAEDDRSLAEAGMSDYAKGLASDVMLDAWCELPRPPVIGRVTPRLVEQLPFDIPHIPTEEDVV